MAQKWGRARKNNYHPEERGRRRGNPLFNRAKKESRFSARFKLIALAAAGVISGIVWLLFFSRFFLIAGPEISGTNETTKREIAEKFSEQSGKSRWIFFRQNNLFIFDKSGFISRLNNDYIFQKLEIKKRLLNRLIINFEEKENSFVLREGDKFYYIDDAGRILKEADPLSISTSRLAVVENQTAPLAGEKTVDREAKRVAYVRSLYEALKEPGDKAFVAERFIIDSDLHTVKLKVASSGPEILFNTESTPESQLDRLYILIKDKLGEEYLKKRYIDLRFGELIYYQ
ncbi:MAG: hypothetical protein WCW25_00045 [Patescibacteria group bacterium]|jgi:cell division septal protein FtsQ